jgi:ATP-binding cassette subfamily B protein
MVSIGLIVLFLFYSERIFDQLFFIGNTFKRATKIFADAGEMLAILDTDHAINDISDALEMRVSKGAVNFDQVTFSYDHDRKIFD